MAGPPRARYPRWAWLLTIWLASSAARADEDAILFTPPGFDRVGRPATAEGERSSRLSIVVRDRATGRPTPCRLNVVGADGNYYQPAGNPLTPFSLTGEWPKAGKGNRAGKAPIRYFGRFFYSAGEVAVAVPAGPVRVEVWKGFEYRPQAVSTKVEAGEAREVELVLERSVDMAALGFDSGDSHLHFRRETDAEDAVLFDLMEAEDIRFACLLGYNEPPGPYRGAMETLDYPQLRGLGARSIRSRGRYHLLSGQEYRSGAYGHLNLFLRDDLVLAGRSVNADDGPPYGLLGRETLRAGGHAVYAHGGYAQAIYADFVQGDVEGVELLQFGEYRGIGLEDWYRILNIGYRFPCLGASDYPACRKLGDCLTYVEQGRDGRRDFAGWLRGLAEGRSFATTGPLLLLDVDGQRPGAILRKTGPGPHRVSARVRAISTVAPITNLQLIVNGRVVEERTIPRDRGLGDWLELSRPVELGSSSWIAARAFSKATTGAPDAEAHTNPVYAYLDGKAPYDRDALDHLLGRLDAQMDAHRKRSFPEKARVLDDFQRSRDILLKIRAAGGLPAEGLPADWRGDQAGPIDPSARAHSDEQLEEFLKPVPPRPPAEAIKAIEAAGGFRLELVAAEPLVCSPVAAAFDEDGDLYVAEMRDYPYRPKEGRKPLGTVRLLRDRDGDGRFDEAHVFADGLLWAAGVAPWKGGVFVASPPDIWYLKDTDGDHVADLRKRVYTGFGTENEQGMLNNLTFGLDHRIYGSSSTNGGVVRPADDPKAPGIDIHKKDFRFDPASGAFEAITGSVQFGTTFDDWGNRFLCSESRPLVHAILPMHYLARNPYLPVATALRDVSGHPVPIHRISPMERWRQIRSSRRIAHGERSAESAGASHHVIDAAAGVTIYRGGAYPPEYYGNAFVGDAQNNLIHRMALAPDGVTFRAVRADEGTEFVRSYDNWFRPVNLLNAPDGTLYALDMSREVIEAVHIPLDVVRHLDLRRGRDQGRIYRIAPPGFRSPPPPRLGSATTAGLVAALESPHGWHRDTAHRLIYERRDRSAASPLRRLLAESPRPQARLHALWSLQGLGLLTDEDLAAGLADPAPVVREQAVRLAEPRLDVAPKLLGRVLSLAGDAEARVRLQVAFSLGESRDARAVAALARIARSDGADPWLRAAVLSSAGESADRLLAELLRDPGPTTGDLLGALAATIGDRGRPAEVRRALEAIAGGGIDPDLRRRLVLGLGRGLRRSGGSLTAASEGEAPAARLVADLLARAEQVAVDEGATEPARLQAIDLLGCASLGRSRASLAALLDPHRSRSVQLAALRALSGYDAPEVAGLLLEHFPRFAPEVRSRALDALLSRDPWALAFLRAARSGEVAAGQVDLTRRRLLIGHKDPAIAAAARQALGDEPAPDRARVLADYAGALTLPGDPTRGGEVFRRQCSACHRIGDQGHAVGPELSASQFRDPAALLTHILDPNRYVAPNYVQYVATDRGGRVVTGLIASETASSLTLRRDEGAEETILRSHLDELASTGKSLMPEGLEREINTQAMADLIAFLIGTQGGRPDAPAPLDIGTLPGLVEPDE